MTDIAVSIVTGTYNRLPLLQRLIASIRYSAGGLRYEIIVVDGGSDDGTIEYCSSQEDVILIQQGKLLGAVKAFNEGAYAASGRYVILANDDIVFVNEGIILAVAFMEDNVNRVGIGCFFQDRNGREMHVDRMEANYLGQQVYVPYGQVCIVPKELGDHVGWWGDYLHTYGGDNELSCNVWETGLQVAEMKCCCIHDSEHADDLRKINNPVTPQSGLHPDTAKWQNKWRSKWGKEPKFGAKIPQTVLHEMSYKRSTRVVYMPIYEQGHFIQKSTKTGLRRALERRNSIVLELEYQITSHEELLYKTVSFQPDVIIIQVQDGNSSVITPQFMKQLNIELPNTKLVSWNGDYHPDNLYNESYMHLLRHFHHCGFALAGAYEAYCKRNGVNWFYWQIGYEDFEIDKTRQGHDIVFMGNCYSKARRQLGEYLRWFGDQYGVDVGLYGNWPPELKPNGENLYDFSDGASIYANSFIAISDQQWPSATGYVSNRLFQILAAGGCIVLQQQFDGMNEYLGLEHAHHLYTWSSLKTLTSLLITLLENRPSEILKQVAENGKHHVLTNHSFDKRVEELWNILRKT